MVNQNAMLAVEGLGFAYAENQVFSNVSFTVKKGSLCGLFGPNGSGNQPCSNAAWACSKAVRARCM